VPKQEETVPAEAMPDFSEQPAGALANRAAYGSDLVVDFLRACDIPYVALNPGASFRGLHDSLVNYGGNRSPQMLLCLHEESAVAIAHGYAKVTGRPMAAAVHANIGLMHATMAIFNAWCDRMPMLVLGGSGPADAARRRPWIEWIHSARDQAAMIRPYVKWDDEPRSAKALQESLARALWQSVTPPMGPTYVAIDSEIQEGTLPDGATFIDPSRFMPPVEAGASDAEISMLADRFQAARHPVVLCGRSSRSADAWLARVALAEHFKAAVITDPRLGASFPTEHPLFVGGTAKPLPKVVEKIRAADLIVSLDITDLGGFLSMCYGDASPAAEVINISLDHRLHNGWSMDHMPLPPTNLHISASPEKVVAALNAKLGIPVKDRPIDAAVAAGGTTSSASFPGLDDLAAELRRAAAGREVSLLHVPIAWRQSYWDYRHPLDFIGNEAGGGLGSGPGISVGAALALKGSGRLPIGICGDGDYLMGVTALWTAAHYRIPLMLVIANNSSYFNDELHQETVAKDRDRPVGNKWIGQKLIDPEPDLVGFATAQGAVGIGPVSDVAELAPAYAKAIAAVDAGGVAVVDVRIKPGY
jgi:thiamine pyrophosphate-dependent acetolactate synthase large subunit-like protein